jgi:toxin ParE1/3/4
MPKVLLSRQAEADLDEIWDYLESRNPDAALRVIGEINGVIELISNFPLAGRAHEALDGEPRIFPVRNYLVVYEIVADVGVQILRVYHASRDRGRML